MSVLRLGSLLACAVFVFLAAPGCTERAELPDVPFDASFDGRLDAPRADGGACVRDGDCSDRIACTIDLCEGGSCSHEPCLDCCEAGLTCDPSRGCAPAPMPCTDDAECLDAVRCTLDFCRGGFCEQRPNNALCEPGEICLAAVGCIPEPPETCETAADCASAAVCVGEWQCEPEFGCQFVSALDCDDGNDCTTDRCDEAMGGCVHAPFDADGDNHQPMRCAGDDCDDGDASRHPGAAEICGDGIDQNCDGRPDDGCCTAGPCVTPCGTMGAFACLPDGTPGACIPPVETCDGRDEDCDGNVDETFGCPLGASEACDPGCGSAGTRSCGTGCVWSTCSAPTESCNGADDDCDGMPDDGFDCVRGSSGSCPTACGSTGTRACTSGCSWDLCVSPPEVCNGVDDDCDTTCDDGFSCCSGSTRACSALGFFSGTAVCRSDCGGFDTSTCTNCGNGVRNAPEACDGADLGGATCTSLGMGFAPGGTLRCAAGCMYDTSSCTRCGNGTIDAGEQCDGSALGGATCVSRGFTSGTLRCGSTCGFDTSGCTRCGNGTREPGEGCDDGNTRDGDGCSATCTVEACDPDGTYALSTPVAYTCCSGLVSVNVSSFTMSMDGASIASSPSNPAPLVGAATTCPAGSFNGAASLPGGCAESYRLRGSFTGPNTWTGTYELTFTGPDCSCLGGLLGTPCINQTFPLTGTRL